MGDSAHFGSEARIDELMNWKSGARLVLTFDTSSRFPRAWMMLASLTRFQLFLKFHS
jgi:hypothetical protein